jgi:23S rRNA pseudouridine955/2504/2580 synthase
LSEIEPAAPVELKSAVRHVEVDAQSQGQRLDKLLAQWLLGVPRSRIFRLIRRGEVRVNGRRAGPEQRLAVGDSVRLPPVRASTPDAPRRVPASLIETVERAILHEDARLLVLDKPSGLAVHGGSGLSFGVIEALRASRPSETLELVHRLDRDTSGCLMVARRGSALRTLHALLREGAVQKGYLALTAGRWNLGHKRIDAPLRTDLRVGGERTVRVDAEGKLALTEFKLIEQYGARASLLEAIIVSTRYWATRSTATRLPTVRCASSGSSVCSCTRIAAPSSGRMAWSRASARPCPPSCAACSISCPRRRADLSPAVADS